MKLAAIDIGSNAARLLITEIENEFEEKPRFQKLNLVRIPLRLGFDVFEHNTISDEKVYMLIQTLKAFRHLINVYGVQAVKTCATSAMRDASNTQQILATVKKETGLEIEVISGEEEASLIFENSIDEIMDETGLYVYIDVGGGSTEISFLKNGKRIEKQSFNIGTIRLLTKGVPDTEWDKMKDYLKMASKGQKKIIAIGSGGNINKVFSMSKKKDGKPLHIELLRSYHKEFSSFTLEERIINYNLRADRADVIVPALLIYITAMRWAGAEEIFVPKIGLADGLIKHLWKEMRTAESKQL